MNKQLKMVATDDDASPGLSETGEIAVRSSDYALGELEMALAISTIPAQRRHPAWLLALAAPVATAGIREAIRPKLAPDANASAWALLGPALVGLAGAGALLMTRYGAPRARCRCG
jgi:hypothetical protein